MFTHSVFADQQGNAIVSKTNFDSASKTFEVTAQQSDNGKAIKGIVHIWSKEMVKMIEVVHNSNGIRGKVKV